MTVCNILYITNLPAPYKRPRLNAISNLDDVNITVYYSAQSNRRHNYDDLPDAEFEAQFASSKNIHFGKLEAILDFKALWNIMSIDADVYVVGGWNHFPTWAALIASKLRDTPIGVISANTEQGKYSKILLSQLLKPFDFYLALSQAAQANFVELGIDETDITVLPNVIDVEKFQSSISASVQNSLRDKWKLPNSGVVLYVGNLESEKGVQDLICAISMVDEPNHLLVIGDGPYRNELESLSERKDISITFTGQIPNSRLPNFYALSDIFVLPTHGDTWGLVVNEALACGTPVISTTAAGVSSELLRDHENGLIIPPKVPEELANSIEYLLSNDELRSQYGQAGVQLSAQYTPQKYAEKLIESIELEFAR